MLKMQEYELPETPLCRRCGKKNPVVAVEMMPVVVDSLGGCCASGAPKVMPGLFFSCLCEDCRRKYNCPLDK